MQRFETISGDNRSGVASGAPAVVPEPRRAPRVWAVGGGKGGVGKSVVAANLAAALAIDGRCALVDADLGGSNAHTLLGVARPRHTLSHFLDGSLKFLEQAMCETSIPNLWLVSGSRAIFDAANLPHARKQKLLRHIASLSVDHVVLDLGSGSAFNVLDFFLAASRGIVVTTPEVTAIDNTYHFLKAAFFRSLRRFARTSPVRTALEQVLAEGNRSALTPRGLIVRAARVDANAGRLLLERARAFSPLLIVNQVTSRDQQRLIAEIAATCRTHLGCEVEPFASLEDAEQVREAVDRQLPVMQLYPGCPFARSVRVAAERLSDYRRPEPAGAGSGFRLANPVHPAASAAPGSSASVGERRTDFGSLPPIDRANPGHYLRRCREQLGLSLGQMHERTRIRHLQLVEQERFDELPPEPYVRGYVIAYARALGISDPSLVAADYLECWRRAIRPGAIVRGSGTLLTSPEPALRSCEG